MISYLADPLADIVVIPSSHDIKSPPGRLLCSTVFAWFKLNQQAKAKSRNARKTVPGTAQIRNEKVEFARVSSVDIAGVASSILATPTSFLSLKSSNPALKRVRATPGSGGSIEQSPIQHRAWPLA